jgi:hypothetical protein
MAGAKRLADVEDIIAWACAEELPKKRAGGKVSPLVAFRAGTSRSDRELVGRWNRPASYPTVSPTFARGFAPAGGRGGEPHPDALIVEAAVLELGTRLAELAPPAAISAGIGLPHDLAGAWRAAAANVANLVFVHGRLRSRPYAGEERFEIRPVCAANGKPGVWRTERRVDQLGVERDFDNPAQRIRSNLYQAGSFCRLAYDPDPQLVVNDRAEYFAWRLAMETLCDALSERLAVWTALGAAAAWFPWLGDEDGRKPRNLFQAGAERVHGAAEAAEQAVAREHVSGDVSSRRPNAAGAPQSQRAARRRNKAARIPEFKISS